MTFRSFTSFCKSQRGFALSLLPACSRALKFNFPLFLLQQRSSCCCHGAASSRCCLPPECQIRVIRSSFNLTLNVTRKTFQHASSFYSQFSSFVFEESLNAPLDVLPESLWPSSPRKKIAFKSPSEDSVPESLHGSSFHLIYPSQLRTVSV